jgi:hypothetical protein
MMISRRKKLGFLFFIFSLTGGLVAWAGFLATQQDVEKFRLAFCPATGSNLIYSMSTITNMTARKDFLGRDISLDASAAGEINLFIKAATSERTLTSLTTPGIHIDVQFPDSRTQFDIATLETGPVQAVFSRWGRLEEIQNIENLDRQNKLNVTLKQIARDFFPVFPREEIAVGESWFESKSLVIPFQGINLHVLIDETYFFDSVFLSSEGRIAKISVNYRVQLMGSKSLGDTIGAFEGQGRGSGMLNIQIDGGYFSEFRIEHKTEGSFIIKKGNTELFNCPFYLTVNASTILIGRF